MKNEKPILFKAEMVRAILEGLKTQTRRIIKPQPTKQQVGEWYDDALGLKCPYNVPRLWVKETFANCECGRSDCNGLYFRADGEEINAGSKRSKWKPSIFMPHCSSRIFLKVLAVSVERLQDITEDDAESEGCSGFHNSEQDIDAVSQYRKLWESINGAVSWAANPFVWKIQFEVVK